ncbi:MAG TPA: AMP-binding protein, partial [Pseudonocardiaceae bacterium]|nr:AMP-binding protein [Pseudonocardiaceae bacterium]
MGSTNESSTPPRYEVPPGANVTDDLMERVAAAPDHAVFARKVAGGWHTVGYREFADQATALAAGLIAVGMAPGERVAILSATCYEWVLCDVAILLAGGVTVPLYETSSPEQVAWQLADSGAVGVFAGDPAQAAGASSVWSMTDGIEELTARGHVVPREDVERRRHIATAGSPATIVYTSGTTGRPKGCVITHGNLLSEVHSVLSADDIADTVITDRTPILLFLPLAHILTRVVQFAAL